MPAAEVRERLRADLARAMRDRDAAAVAALRSTIGALDNAEAVAHDEPVNAPRTESPIAGAVVGLGATDRPRRQLTADEVMALLRAEVAERETAADLYERNGQPEAGARLRAEAAALLPHLG